MTNTYTLGELQQAPVAHTDKGDFLFIGGTPEKEFLVLGEIKKFEQDYFS